MRNSHTSMLTSSQCTLGPGSRTSSDAHHRPCSPESCPALRLTPRSAGPPLAPERRPSRQPFVVVGWAARRSAGAVAAHEHKSNPDQQQPDERAGGARPTPPNRSQAPQQRATRASPTSAGESSKNTVVGMGCEEVATCLAEVKVASAGLGAYLADGGAPGPALQHDGDAAARPPPRGTLVPGSGWGLYAVVDCQQPTDDEDSNGRQQ
jgi:hypothetical protein